MLLSAHARHCIGSSYVNGAKSSSATPLKRRFLKTQVAHPSFVINAGPSGPDESLQHGTRSSQGSPKIYSLPFCAMTSGFATEALATKAAAIVVKSMKISRSLQKIISKMSPSSSVDQKRFMECFQQSRLGWQESYHTSKQRCLAYRHSFKKRRC